MNFASDNAAGVAPEIMAAMAAANPGSADAYGADDFSGALDGRFSDLFETDVAVFPVATGTAANALALAALVPPFGVIFAHENAHVEEDECGAPEFYTGGAKLRTMPGAEGRLTPEELEAALGRIERGVQHHAQPAALSLSQATELGTVYGPDDIKALAEIARAHDVKLHMDGARFANALVQLGAAPADVTWRAGVDVLAFGATKNGAMAAEAVVFFDRGLARDFLYRRKRGGHLFSKMRYVSAQLLAYVADDLWLRNAGHANAMAAKLAVGLSEVPGARLVLPVQANEVFVQLLDEVAAALRAAGFSFNDWPQVGESGYRLVTSFDTAAADVDRLIATATSAATELARRTA